VTTPATAECRDIDAIRRDFPILSREVNGYPLVFLDNAATTQKPRVVIQAMTDYYERYNANIHRGVYTISEEATAAYEGARARVAAFLNAKNPKEVIFVRNATEAMNLVAQTWGRVNIKAGDAILLTVMEHHSNLVPWQLIAKEKGARLEFLDIDSRGRLILDDLEKKLSQGVKLVGITQMSNVLGTVNPVREIAAKAHQYGAVVLVDGAQGVPHVGVDVQALDCDFLAFSGHKMCGPTGIGVLYGKRALLEAMPPFMGGGDMIRVVRLHEATWNDLPWKFEAGTPAIMEGIVMGTAVDYIKNIGFDFIRHHEWEIVRYTMERLEEIPDVTVYGPAAELRGGVVSFNVGDIHPHDMASILDRYGICIRAGHHCAQPLMERLGVVATCRASFYFYNCLEEVDRLIEGIYKAQAIFKG